MKNIACLALLICACVTPAFALTADIVYISFNGLDTNPCTRSAPCKTITHALTVVGVGGHVDVIGSGTYDTFTITKPITVEAEPGVVATIDVPSSGTGITVTAGSSDVITLRNLYLHGTGGTGDGIKITTGGVISVEDCLSQNFSHALDYEPTASSNLSVKGGSYEGADTSIFLCCAMGARYTAVFDGVHIYGGKASGVNADGNQITVTRSLITGTGFSGVGVSVVHGTAVLENDVISSYFEGISVQTNTTAYIPASICKVCGIECERTYCASCGAAHSREEFDRGRLAAQTPESRGRRSATQKGHVIANRAWRPSKEFAWLDKETYVSRIQPRLAGVAISVLQSALGISEPYAASIRSGCRIPHPRHWPPLARLVGVSPDV